MFDPQMKQKRGFPHLCENLFFVWVVEQRRISCDQSAASRDRLIVSIISLFYLDNRVKITILYHVNNPEMLTSPGVPDKIK